MDAGGSSSLAAQYLELFSSVTEDENLQIAAAAAMFTAVCYQLLFKSSQLLSPKMCRAYRRLKPGDQLDWNSRLPSTLHAVVVSALCIWALCYSGAFFDTTAATAGGAGAGSGSAGTTSSSSSYGDSSSSSIQQLPVVLRVSAVSYAIIGISFGYFIMDAALLSLHPELATREMCVHHAVALMSLVVAAQVAAMHVYLMLVLLTELTTPIVNLRWWLDKAELKHLKLYTINGLLLLLVWGVARVVLFGPFYVHVLANWSTIQTIPLHAIVLLLGVPLLLAALNFMWFMKIVKGAYKLVFNKQQQTQAQQTQTQQQIQPTPEQVQMMQQMRMWQHHQQEQQAAALPTQMNAVVDTPADLCKEQAVISETALPATVSAVSCNSSKCGKAGRQHHTGEVVSITAYAGTGIKAEHYD